MSLSVLILTFNEERNIAECIRSVPWRQDVHVLDSESGDDTRRIAGELGATVHCRPFTDFADQRNFGLCLNFANEWIVCLDADERMTPELAREIEFHAKGSADDLAMMIVRRRDIFMRRWLRRSSGFPTWFPRVFRRGSVSVCREVNERYEARGRVKRLDGHLVHFPLNKGLEWWFERHNSYSTLEARALSGRAKLPDIRAMASADPLVRRQALKALAYSMPFRPFLTFVYLYIVRLGFLDGSPGYQFACMRMAYEIMIDAKRAVAGASGARQDGEPG